MNNTPSQPGPQPERKYQSSGIDPAAYMAEGPRFAQWHTEFSQRYLSGEDGLDLKARAGMTRSLDALLSTSPGFIDELMQDAQRYQAERGSIEELYVDRVLAWRYCRELPRVVWRALSAIDPNEHVGQDIQLVYEDCADKLIARALSGADVQKLGATPNITTDQQRLQLIRVAAKEIAQCQQAYPHTESEQRARWYQKDMALDFEPHSSNERRSEYVLHRMRLAAYLGIDPAVRAELFSSGQAGEEAAEAAPHRSLFKRLGAARLSLRSKGQGSPGE